MQLGKEVASGFVSDEAQAAPDAETGPPPGTLDAKAPEEPAAPEPERAAAS